MKPAGELSTWSRPLGAALGLAVLWVLLANTYPGFYVLAPPLVAAAPATIRRRFGDSALPAREALAAAAAGVVIALAAMGVLVGQGALQPEDADEQQGSAVQASVVLSALGGVGSLLYARHGAGRD